MSYQFKPFKSNFKVLRFKVEVREMLAAGEFDCL